VPDSLFRDTLEGFLSVFVSGAGRVLLPEVLESESVGRGGWGVGLITDGEGCLTDNTGFLVSLEG